MKKLSLILAIALSLATAQSTYAYVLKINKTFLDHDPKGELRGYNYVNRQESIEYEPLAPTQIKSKTVDVFCEGNGTRTCPNSIVAPGDNATPANFMTLSAINAAQVILNSQVSAYENDGIRNNTSGSVSTPDGFIYNYTVTWTTNPVTGAVNLDFVFSSGGL